MADVWFSLREVTGQEQRHENPYPNRIQSEESKVAVYFKLYSISGVEIHMLISIS